MHIRKRCGDKGSPCLIPLEVLKDGPGEPFRRIEKEANRSEISWSLGSGDFGYETYERMIKIFVEDGRAKKLLDGVDYIFSQKLPVSFKEARLKTIWAWSSPLIHIRDGVPNFFFSENNYQRGIFFGVYARIYDGR
uniref:TypeVII secretion protein n=1 Tax=Papaver somniferum TaxID=3469 RepID=A0A5B7LJL7_PAPSO|nr:typeVII secretion protein [Papaver somniferum]